MECPSGISFQRLLDFAEGKSRAREARPVAEHLGSGCAVCRDNYAWIQRVVRLMRTDPVMLAEGAPLFPAQAAASGPCSTTFEQLVDYVDRRLPTPQVLMLDSHLASSCERCLAQLDWLQHTLPLMARDQLVQVPSEVVQRAVALFPGQPAPRASAPGILERIVATLRADNRGMRPVAVRGVAAAARRQLFAAGEWQVDLQFENERDTRRLVGQVLCRSAAPGTLGQMPVILQREGRTLSSTVTESTGEFSFEGLASGRYELMITCEGAEVVVEGLDV